MQSRFVQTYDLTVYPDTNSPVDIGEFVLGAEDDTIWIKVTSAPQSGCPWPWSYGLLTWITDNGRELGTVKINGVCEGEVFRLGVGLPPLERTGDVLFTPRSYNRAWISISDPPIWSLSFEAQSGKSGVAPSPSGIGAVVNSFVDTSDNGLSLVRVNFP